MLYVQEKIGSGPADLWLCWRGAKVNKAKSAVVSGGTEYPSRKHIDVDVVTLNNLLQIHELSNYTRTTTSLNVLLPEPIRKGSRTRNDFSSSLNA